MGLVRENEGDRKGKFRGAYVGSLSGADDG